MSSIRYGTKKYLHYSIACEDYRSDCSIDFDVTNTIFVHCHVVDAPDTAGIGDRQLLLVLLTTRH
jgi:hypothetical protein